jgi:large subunit ribosomal protein L22
MKVQAHLKNLKISPRKVRLVAGLIRGKNVDVAREQLKFSLKKSATPILKLLKSAIANAEHNYHLDPKLLKIEEIFVNQGMALKRVMPRAMGRAAQFKRQMSHVTIVVGIHSSSNESLIESKTETKEHISSENKEIKTKKPISKKKSPVSTPKKGNSTKK